eukprot:2298915-Amphidinium_carterae.1
MPFHTDSRTDLEVAHLIHATCCVCFCDWPCAKITGMEVSELSEQRGSGVEGAGSGFTAYGKTGNIDKVLQAEVCSSADVSFTVLLDASGDLVESSVIMATGLVPSAVQVLLGMDRDAQRGLRSQCCNVPLCHMSTQLTKQS